MTGARTVLVLLCASAVLISERAHSKERCRPGNPYFFSEFNPASWKAENELNYEEVYKNYEYFEVVFSQGCGEITVRRYVKGQYSSSERYAVNPDGSLQKRGN